MKKINILAWSVVPIFLLGASVSQAVTVFSETFDGVTTGYINESCGSGCSHSVQHGAPTTGGGTTVNGGADENWYGARFEYPDGGSIISDIGTQEFGGNGNNTPVGLLSDDAGLMFKLDTTGLTGVTLDFDWRTFKAASGDKVVAGYYIGDLFGDMNSLGNTVPGGLAANRTADLRNEVHFNNDADAPLGPHDGPWNWNPDGAGGNVGNWVEILRDNGDTWSNENFDLSTLDNQSEVWIAFWLDNGNKDFGKIDNVTVTATVVPVPAAVWLFGSGLLGLVGVARRRNS